MADKDKEKCEMSKQLLKNTMKSHETGSSKISELINKICYKFLKILPKNVKVFACLPISCSTNNSYVPVKCNESQIKMIPK